MTQSYKHNFWDYVEYLFMILCFPLNPLVLLNIVEPNSKNLLSISGTMGSWDGSGYLSCYIF